MGNITMEGKKRKRRQAGSMRYGIYRSYDLRKVKKQKFISGLLILIITLMFNIIVNSNFVKAEDNSANTDGCNKCYKSIVLEYGDTLWGIATEYKGIYYESTQDYIDEVMSINHLTTDKIHAGQYLAVPYYESNDLHNMEYSVRIYAKNNEWY